MRWLLAVITVLLLLGARDAWATCGGCCDNAAQLLAWSKDGRTIAVRETIAGQTQTVIYRDNKELERWGGAGSDERCNEPKPAMPANTYVRHGLVPLATAWREAFRTGYKVVSGKRPVRIGTATCSGHDVVDATGRVIASVVNECDLNETDCVRGRVLGGYIHPAATHALIKQRVQGCGYTSRTSYHLVRI